MAKGKLVEKQEEKVKFQLTALDRCDRCDAQAFVKASGVNGELLFCSHHYNKHMEEVKKWAYEIMDERDNNKCSCSSCVSLVD